MFEPVCISIQGYSHVKNDIPCEDCGQIINDDHAKLFAVADGHGDSNCPRSLYGSKCACNIALSSLKEFFTTIQDSNLQDIFMHDSFQQDVYAKQLINSIVMEWTDSVNSHFENNPLNDKERKDCKKYIDRYDKGERIEHIYGTTLIAGLLTEKYLLLIQQGDGKCDVFYDDGTVKQPIPWDDKCFANVTTSLCDEDASKRFRYIVIDLMSNPIIAVFAGSDGVDDSFLTNDQVHEYYRNLILYSCENGVNNLNKYLKETLFDFSKTGSGDDTTICGYIDVEKCKPYINKFNIDNDIVKYNSELKYIDSRLKSLNGMGKTDALKARLDEANNDVQQYKKKLALAKEEYQKRIPDLKDALSIDEEEQSPLAKLISIVDYTLNGNWSNKIQEKIDFLENNVDEYTKKLDDALHKKEDAERLYLEHMDRYNKLFEQKKAILQKIEDINNEKSCDDISSENIVDDDIL